jgi:hypothetical protein
LAQDPEHGEATDLPYHNLEHLRFCLATVGPDTDKHTKTVDRVQPQQFPYRCIKSGFYVGDRDSMLCYPFPDHDALEGEHYIWWRSAEE